MMLHPNQLLDMKRIKNGGYTPRWRLTTIEMIERIFKINDTSMKFGGFKG